MANNIERLAYQLKKFEVLIKRRAGQHCILDWTKREIVGSNEDKKIGGRKKIIEDEKIKAIITWLKEANARLQKEDPGGGQILLSYARLGREAKRLRNLSKPKTFPDCFCSNRILTRGHRHEKQCLEKRKLIFLERLEKVRKDKDWNAYRNVLGKIYRLNISKRERERERE